MILKFQIQNFLVIVSLEKYIESQIGVELRLHVSLCKLLWINIENKSIKINLINIISVVQKCNVVVDML